MSEPKPTYQVTTSRDSQQEKPTSDVLLTYLWRRREWVIAELRELDRLLGRQQTIPERTR